MTSVHFIGLSAILAAVVAGPAAAGTKTINNNTATTIKVTVVPRTGSGCRDNGAAVAISIKAGQSGTLDYSTDFMNSIAITGSDSKTKAKFSTKLSCSALGTAPTLNDAFNDNAIFEIGYSAYSVTFSAHH